MHDLIKQLDNFHNSTIHFNQVTYIMKSINFSYFWGDTILASLAPLLDRIGSNVKPMQHAVIELASAAGQTLPCPECMSTKPRHYLAVHMQSYGPKGELHVNQFPRPNHGDVSSMMWSSGIGRVEPRWISAFLRSVANRPYSRFSWNCQHFAYELLSFLGEKCREESGQEACPPKDLESVLPLQVFLGWKKYITFSISLSILVFITLLAFKGVAGAYRRFFFLKVMVHEDQRSLTNPLVESK